MDVSECVCCVRDGVGSKLGSTGGVFTVMNRPTWSFGEGSMAIRVVSSETCESFSVDQQLLNAAKWSRTHKKPTAAPSAFKNIMYHQ